MFLTREYGVDVVALDLWVSEEELRGTLRAAAVADRVTAVQGSARDLPFDDAEFDAVVSVDAFEYVGTDVHFLPAGRARTARSPGCSSGTPGSRSASRSSAPPRSEDRVAACSSGQWQADRS